MPGWVLRDVIMDYVHHLVVRVCLLVLLGFSLAAMVVWVMRILLVRSRLAVDL